MILKAFKTVLLLTLSFLSFTYSRELGQYSQRYSDDYLNQRLCLAMQVGFDYLESSMSMLMDGYLKFYDNPKRFEYQRKDKPRFN